MTQKNGRGAEIKKVAKMTHATKQPAKRHENFEINGLIMLSIVDSMKFPSSLKEFEFGLFRRSLLFITGQRLVISPRAMAVLSIASLAWMN